MPDILMIVVLVAIVLLVIVFFRYVPVGLWIRARASGVPLTIMMLVGMRLRRISPNLLVDALITANKAGHNIPDSILRLVTALLLQARQAGRLDSITYCSMAEHINQLTAIQGACERIRYTALPFAYTLLLHRTAHIFCVLLPLGLVHSLGHATPLLTALVAYTFFGLDALGDELEEPFGTSQNDLPLDAITRVIEIDLAEYRGLENRPEPLKPQNFVLM